MWYPISEENPSSSAVVIEILYCYYKQFISYDRAKTKELVIFCTHMVDFCRPGHICTSLILRTYILKKLLKKQDEWYVCMYITCSQKYTFGNRTTLIRMYFHTSAVIRLITQKMVWFSLILIF